MDELKANEQLVEPGTAPRLWRWRVTERPQESAITVVLSAGEGRFQFCGLQHRRMEFAQQRGDMVYYRYSEWEDVVPELDVAV